MLVAAQPARCDTRLSDAAPMHREVVGDIERRVDVLRQVARKRGPAWLDRSAEVDQHHLTRQLDGHELRLGRAGDREP